MVKMIDSASAMISLRQELNEIVISDEPDFFLISYYFRYGKTLIKFNQ